LIGQERFGNTRKIASELQKQGWTVEIFDAEKQRSMFKQGVPQDVDIVLMIVSHLPNGLTQKVKDACRAVKKRFLEVSPDWSGTSLMLSKYGLLPAPAAIRDLDPKVVRGEQPVFSTPRAGNLTQRPFANLAEKIQEPRPVPVEPVRLKPTMPAAVPVNAPSIVPPSVAEKKALDFANEARTKIMVEKQATARIVLLESPHASADDIQGIIAKKHGGQLDYKRLKEVREKVWAEKGITSPAPTPAKSALSKSKRHERHDYAEELVAENPDITFKECKVKVNEKFSGAGIDEEVFDRIVEKEKKRRTQLTNAGAAPQPVPTPEVEQTASPAQAEPKPEPASEPSEAAVAAVKALEQARLDQAVIARAEHLLAPKKKGYSDEERDDAIRLLKEALVDSSFESLTFRRQQDGTYKVEGDVRVVKKVEY
jgi:hypothetical protein